MATGNITRLEGVWPETHERAVRDSAGVNLETKLGNINSNISQLGQKVGDFSEYDSADYVAVEFELTTGYWRGGSGSLSTQGDNKQYGSLTVLQGEKYKVSGRNVNTSYPGCYVDRPYATDFYVRESTAQSFVDTIIEITASGTLIVNGDTSTQPVVIKKYMTVPGSAEDAFNDLDARKVEKEEGKGLSSNDFTDTDKASMSFINSSVENAPKIAGKNLIDLTKLISGYRVLKSNGSLYADETYSYVEIDVTGINSIVWSSDVKLTSGVVLCKYNGNTYISGIDEIATKDDGLNRYYAVLDVSDATKIITSAAKTVWSIRNFQIEAGSTPTAYEAHYEIPADEFIKDSALSPTVRSIFGSGEKASVASLGDGELVVIPTSAIRKNFRIHFYAKTTSFDTIYVGKGVTNKGYLLKVNNTNIQFKSGVDSAGGTEIPHGLTISTYIDVIIMVASSSRATITIRTLGGAFSYTLAQWFNIMGDVFAESIGSTLTECHLDWSCSDFRKPIWMFGDSYMSHYSDARWPYYLITDDRNDCCLIDAFPGENSDEAFADFVANLKLGTPRFLIWGLGMNNPDSGEVNPKWLAVIQTIQSYCEERGITLILATIPCVPSYDNSYKNAWVKASGERYIDFAEAVGAEQPGSTWIAGTLAQDNTHPTAEGAKLLYARALADVPELLGQEAPITAN